VMTFTTSPISAEEAPSVASLKFGYGLP
jgi:hypothetical protein